MFTLRGVLYMTIRTLGGLSNKLGRDICISRTIDFYPSNLSRSLCDAAKPSSSSRLPTALRNPDASQSLFQCDVRFSWRYPPITSEWIRITSFAFRHTRLDPVRALLFPLKRTTARYRISGDEHRGEQPREPQRRRPRTHVCVAQVPPVSS